MAAALIEATTTPQSGWGINSAVATLDLEDGRTIAFWRTDDENVTDISTADRTSISRGYFPHWSRVYGLHNVSQAQLSDPTWNPPAFRILDDACMVIAMALVPVQKHRGVIWPFNFDSNGNPKPTRTKFGAGVQVHFMDKQPDGWYRQRFATFLVWKNHLVMAGEDGDLTVTSPILKDDRVRHSISDPSKWSHGLQSIPPSLPEDDISGRKTLHLYLTVDGRLQDRMWTNDLFYTNTRGCWFSKWQNSMQIPYMVELSQSVQRANLLEEESEREDVSSDAPATALNHRSNRPSAARTTRSAAAAAGSVPGAASMRQPPAQTIMYRPQTVSSSNPLSSRLPLPAPRSLGVRSRIVQGKRPSEDIRDEPQAKRQKMPSKTESTKEGVQKSVAVQEFFVNYERDHPKDKAAKSNLDLEARKILLRTVMAPWLNEGNSMTKMEQQQAEVDDTVARVQTSLASTIMQLNTLENLERSLQTQIKSVQGQILQTKQSVYYQYDTAMLAMQRQPAHHFLQHTHSAVLKLEELGEPTMARSVAMSIATRLVREPPLLRSSSFTETVPGLRDIITARTRAEAVTRSGNEGTQNKVHDSTADSEEELEIL